MDYGVNQHQTPYALRISRCKQQYSVVDPLLHDEVARFDAGGVDHRFQVRHQIVTMPSSDPALGKARSTRVRADQRATAPKALVLLANGWGIPTQRQVRTDESRAQEHRRPLAVD